MEIIELPQVCTKHCLSRQMTQSPVQIFVLPHQSSITLNPNSWHLLLCQHLKTYTDRKLPNNWECYLISSSIWTFATVAFSAALLLVWIWRTNSGTKTWNFGASFLVEYTLRPALFRARMRCFSATCIWVEQRRGTVDLSTGLQQRIGPVCVLHIQKTFKLNKKIALWWDGYAT